MLTLMEAETLIKLLHVCASLCCMCTLGKSDGVVENARTPAPSRTRTRSTGGSRHSSDCEEKPWQRPWIPLSRDLESEEVLCRAMAAKARLNSLPCILPTPKAHNQTPTTSRELSDSLLSSEKNKKWKFKLEKLIQNVDPKP